MIVGFEYTIDDLQEALTAHRKASSRTKSTRIFPRWAGWALFGGLAVLLLLMQFRPTTVQPTPPIVAPPNQSAIQNVLLPIVPWLLIFVCIWLFVFFWNRRWAASHVWRSQPSLQLRRTLDADPSRLIIDDGQTRVEKKWNSVRTFVETANLFLLYTADHAFDMVPKRAFASPAQVDEFRTLLEQQVQPPTGGFPIQPPPQP